MVARATPRRFESQRTPEYVLERTGMPMGRPEFQFRVAGGAETNDVVVPSRDDVDAVDDLPVAAIQPLRKPRDRAERANDAAVGSFQQGIPLVRLLRGSLAVVPRDERDKLHLDGLEPAQAAVLDQVVRMPVVPVIADVIADVVQQRAVLEPLAFTVPQTMHPPGLIEDAQRQTRDVPGVIRPIPAAVAQFHDAAAPHVGIPLDFADTRGVAVDVVEDEAFPE